MCWNCADVLRWKVSSQEAAGEMNLEFDFRASICVASPSFGHYQTTLHGVFRLSFCRTRSIVVSLIVHSKLDYCNSLYYYLPQFRINILQNIHNSLAQVNAFLVYLEPRLLVAAYVFHFCRTTSKTEVLCDNFYSCSCELKCWKVYQFAKQSCKKTFKL